MSMKEKNDPVSDLAAELLDAAISLGDAIRDQASEQCTDRLLERRGKMDAICQRLSIMLEHGRSVRG